MKQLIDWFKKEESRSSSMITLIIVNLLPLFGVLYWEWDVFPIMLLYWSENVIIGFYNILRMAYCKPAEPAGCGAKLFMILFFTVHYGMFTLAHGFFVVALFNGDMLSSSAGPNPAVLLGSILENNVIFAVIALLLSHGYSFIRNYLGKGEFRRVSLNELMGRPYGRVIILHLALLAGGFLIFILKVPVVGLMLFILLKIIMDLIAHHKEHKKLDQRYYQRKTGTY